MKTEYKESEPLTFLENGFPIDDLYKLALNEGNSKRPIYQIHKWWARRLGSVFRALLISSFLDPDEKYKEFLSKFYNGFSLENKVIYDPMMGGGTSLVEGLRLGCKVIGCDINPVAWFITKKEIENFDEGLIDQCFKNLEEKVGSKIKEFYKTSCKKGHVCESVYVLWIRMLDCVGCGKQVELFNTAVIRHDDEVDTLVCPKCLGVFSTMQKGNKVICNLCSTIFDKEYKVVDNGVFSCPKCGKREKVIDNVRRRGSFLPTKMFAIEYDCKICGRGIKSPDHNDLKLFERSKNIFLKNKHKLKFPRQRISRINGDGDKRPLTHGFRYFYELFNPRQLLSLSLLLEEINRVTDENTREFLLLTFSSCLETNNVLCKYETNWGKISALFGIPAYHVPERYGENNLWGVGRGSFPRTYLKMKRGKKYARDTYEVMYTKLRGQKRFTGESSLAVVSKNISDFLLPGQKAQLFCRDSSNMKMIKSKSVDVIITDPPYFDTINYSRLADFFYVWLRLGLKSRYPWFKPRTSKRSKEIVVSEDSMSQKRFVSHLGKILRESKRVLKDNGLLLFTFHHTKTWAWRGLRNALKNSGFVVTATPILRSEGRTGFRKEGNTSYDVCVVCRKSSSVVSDGPTHMNINNFVRLVNYFKRLDPYFTPSDVFTVLMSNYLKLSEDSAELVLKNAQTLVTKIRDKNIKSNY